MGSWRTAFAALLACAGCGFTHGAAAGGGDGGRLDGPKQLDAPADMAGSDAVASACVTVASLGVNLCPSGAPASSLEITADESLKTDDGTSMPSDPQLGCAALMPGGTPAAVCVVYAQTIKIDANATLSAHGGKALVLFATGSIDVEGTIDVASHIAGGPQRVGPGPTSACDAGMNPSGGGGGQGGSFGSVGGAGGADANGTPGGTAGAVIVPANVTLARGCDGHDGAGAGGTHGSGGGVVLLSTPHLTIGDAGIVNASGSAATGPGSGNKGGGGAGSGGLIVLDASTITITGAGQVFANGAGGSSGSSNGAGVPGNDPPSASAVALGGNASSNAGDGGNGAFGATDATQGNAGQSGDGGGGGGGGVGFVMVHSGSNLSGNANVSPAPTSI